MNWMSPAWVILMILVTCSHCFTLLEPSPNRLYIDDIRLLSAPWLPWPDSALLNIKSGGGYKESDDQWCKIMDLNTGLISDVVDCKYRHHDIQDYSFSDVDSTSTIINSIFDHCNGKATIDVMRNNKNIQIRIDMQYITNSYRFCYKYIPFAYFTINTYNGEDIKTSFIFTEASDKTSFIAIKFHGYNDNTYSIHKGKVMNNVPVMYMLENTPLHNHCSSDLGSCLQQSIPRNLLEVSEDLNLLFGDECFYKYQISKSEKDEYYTMTFTAPNDSIMCDGNIDYFGQRVIKTDYFGDVVWIYDLKGDGEIYSFTPYLQRN